MCDFCRHRSNVTNKETYFQNENNNAIALDCFCNLLPHPNYYIVVQLQLRHTLVTVVGIDDEDC